MTDIDAIVNSLMHELERRSQETKLSARTDSVEIGTPSKGGVLKVYFDAGEGKDKVFERVTMAAEALRWANQERARVTGDGQ